MSSFSRHWSEILQNGFLPFPNDPFPKTFSKLKSDNLTFPPNLSVSSLSETDDF